METGDAPVDNGITDGLEIISYVADYKGNQECVPGSMWSPVNFFNRQAWRQIEKKIEASKAKVGTGRVSCLHYYMTANQMDSRLLARYTSQSRWLVRLHMVPFFFNRLGVGTLNKYVEVFKVSQDDLVQGKLQPPVYNQRDFETQLDA